MLSREQVSGSQATAETRSQASEALSAIAPEAARRADGTTWDPSQPLLEGRIDGA